VCASPLGCASTTPSEGLSRLARAIAAVRTSSWRDPRANSCFDCYNTTFTVRTRAADGTVSVSVFSWNDGNVGNVPPDVKSAFASVMSLADPRP
jgi:hypothetical protein